MIDYTFGRQKKKILEIGCREEQLKLIYMWIKQEKLSLDNFKKILSIILKLG